MLCTLTLILLPSNSFLNALWLDFAAFTLSSDYKWHGSIQNPLFSINPLIFHPRNLMIFVLQNLKVYLKTDIQQLLLFSWFTSIGLQHWLLVKIEWFWIKIQWNFTQIHSKCEPNVSPIAFFHFSLHLCYLCIRNLPKVIL